MHVLQGIEQVMDFPQFNKTIGKMLIQEEKEKEKKSVLLNQCQ